jgi:hypothetical protein
MAKITWKNSTFATTKNVDPDAVLDVLDDLLERDGLLTPAAVVAAAEPKDSPLHGAFEWRNSVAASRYREWQARQLIRAIIREEAGGTKEPAFVAIQQTMDDGSHIRGYQSVRVAMSRPDEWLSALEIFNNKIMSSRRSLDDLERIAGSHQDRNRLASIAIAAKALDTAHAALMQ